MEQTEAAVGKVFKGQGDASSILPLAEAKKRRQCFSTQQQDRPTLNKLSWQLYCVVAYCGREKEATAAVAYYTAEDNTSHCQWKEDGFTKL